MSLQNKIKELRDPNTLKSGHVTKLSKGRKVVVKRDKNGKAKYVKALPIDIKCSKSLKKNVKQMLDEAKTKKNKKIKSYSQALAIAYSKTKKQYPRCDLVQQTNKTKHINNSKTKKILKTKKTKQVQNGGGKRVRLQKKIVKMLISKGYILKQDEPYICSQIKGDAIKKLYNNKKDIPENIKKIRNKSEKFNLVDLLSYINSLIYKCSLRKIKSSYPINNKFKYKFRYSATYNQIYIEPTNNKKKDIENIKNLYKFVKELP